MPNIKLSKQDARDLRNWVETHGPKGAERTVAKEKAPSSASKNEQTGSHKPAGAAKAATKK